VPAVVRADQAIGGNGGPEKRSHGIPSFLREGRPPRGLSVPRDSGQRISWVRSYAGLAREQVAIEDIATT
jgi:hypothetical protein